MKSDTYIEEAQYKQRQIRSFITAMKKLEAKRWEPFNLHKSPLSSLNIHIIQNYMIDTMEHAKVTHQTMYVGTYLMNIGIKNWDDLMNKMPSNYKKKELDWKLIVFVVTCIALAANYEEIEPPSIRVLLEHVLSLRQVSHEPPDALIKTKKHLSLMKKHINDMQVSLWSLSNFQVEVPSSFSFITHLVESDANLPSKYYKKLLRNCNKTALKALKLSKFLKLRPSLAATAICIYVARCIIKDLEVQNAFITCILSIMKYSRKRVEIIIQQLSDNFS
ncbi:uncharacterized protein CMU_006220 [Cryptosporidium muris RN66]|uniref:Cyclin C-terminal domain-containing protein n=1 Tax=Cryptosporidium muris (strain RN66) TaxID=441375 RepID=B6AHK4_CRYMR|nr:uncharacterized protein CMU_006220 [Cryptosporidium muris RN66]EEA07699.1 hypothetical protein CMU_006220 [Cryptosporidium muris RN66]|eukprot:XP_002142048.1 hypothetical protein [Cryptosporidium muris RN66]